MRDQKQIDAARAAAAHFLTAQRYSREAKLVAAGEGDDFRKVSIALSLWDIMNPKKHAPPTHRGRRIVGEEC